MLRVRAKRACAQPSATILTKNPSSPQGERIKAADGFFRPSLVCTLVLVVGIVGCAPISLKPRSAECTAAVVVTHGVGGCETTSLASSALDDEGKRFSPAPGKANIYVVRPSIIGGRFLWVIRLDGKPAGSIAANTYLLLEIEPGTHQVTAITSENEQSIVVTANQGENRFLEVVSRMGWTQARVELRALAEEEGKTAIRNTRRAAPPEVAAPETSATVSDRER